MPERRQRILVVDDNLEMARTLAVGLLDRGYDAVAVGSGRQALDRLEAETFDAVVTDLRMPDVDGLEILSASRKLDPDRPVIVMTAYSAIDTAVESIRQGAHHYLTKPFKQDELVIFLERALEQVRVRNEASALRTALRAKFSASRIIGHSPALQAVRERIQRVADAPAPVIILGETGTGKGVVARALHGDSRRAERPFVSVNCAALPEALLESELFGYVKGAFTGAQTSRKGRVAHAEGGTLFLDEVGELPASTQVKLLRVLQDRCFEPVGSVESITADFRLVVATNRDLAAEVEAGRFRRDLYYRLLVCPLVLPPLKERKGDVVPLFVHFWHQRGEKRPIDPEALRCLEQHDWPGNVRELENLVERISVCADGPVIRATDLPAHFQRKAGIIGLSDPAAQRRAMLRLVSEEKHAEAPEKLEFPVDLPHLLRSLEEAYVDAALAHAGGSKKVAADLLGIHRTTLVEKLRRWGREPGKV